jgi:HSP20 family protein
LVDLSETDEAYQFECRLPGIKGEDIDVEVSGRELHITGELKKREREGSCAARRAVPGDASTGRCCPTT